MASRFFASTKSQTMAEFSKHMNPSMLLEIKPVREMRVQESWVAVYEKHALLWLAARTPQWIGPDHLTVLGLVAQIGAGACYALASRHKYALLGAIACLVFRQQPLKRGAGVFPCLA